MISSALILFSLAASLGLFLIILGVRYQRNSLKIALTHAGIGLTALGLLITHVLADASNKFYNVAVLLMILVVVGGLMLFALREKDRPPPMILVTIHVIFAIAALIVLLMGFS